MIGLIADLLDAGRIETGTLSVSPEPSRIDALVDQARSTFVSGGARHAVSVADEGRGIAPERLRHLFRKYPAPGDREDGLGGGLGLAICKGLVEAHGGRIRAESPGWCCST